MPMLPVSSMSMSRLIQRETGDCGTRWMWWRGKIHRITLSGYTQSSRVMQNNQCTGDSLFPAPRRTFWVI
jgi:hypothetical protein